MVLPIMCKEHTLSRSANLLSRNHATLHFSFYGGVCLKFLRAITSETMLNKGAVVQFSQHEHELQPRFFPVKIAKFSRTPNLQNICTLLLLILHQLFALVALQIAFHTSIYVMFMVTNLIEPRTRKLILNHLIGNNCPEFRDGPLDSYFSKINRGSNCFGPLFQCSLFQNHSDSAILQKQHSLY